ncbi:unnamed protein product [Larinioides sclopetarius]|uniref:Estradiol 17-beta-dehydrogenase 2 n=1 Tax=Larinioides sclopetarius TaxID=280406 RepID=A0AAV1YX54_9ARAC
MKIDLNHFALNRRSPLFLDWRRLQWFHFESGRHFGLKYLTGCDSGFGNALAKRLDAKGFEVFATCLFPTGTGAKELMEGCSNRLRVLHMDVTKDDSVKKAFEYVKQNLGSAELWAVVNNAGINKGFSVEFSSMEDFRDCIDVNLLGYVRVTKAFLPLLKRTKGRIVNITSASGEFSLPFFTPYTVSKHAAVGFTDCLRLELETLGISVVSIEPELFLTGLTCPDIVDKNLDAKLESLGPSLKEDYGGSYATSLKDVEKLFLSFACSKISIVVDDLESAVSLENPYHTYKPRRHVLSRFLCFCGEVIPRSCHILIMKLFFRLFFSKSKAIKDVIIKIVSWM